MMSAAAAKSAAKARRDASTARKIASAIRSSDFAALQDAVLAGVPVRVLDDFQQRSGLPWEALHKVLRLPLRTLARRRTTGRLSIEESDRLVGFVQLFERAVRLLDGDTASAKAWFLGPNRTFGGATPLKVAETQIGSTQVEQLLGRLEHGVFS